MRLLRVAGEALRDSPYSLWGVRPLIDRAHPQGGWYHLPGPASINLRESPDWYCAVSNLQHFDLWWPAAVLEAARTLEEHGTPVLWVYLLEVPSEAWLQDRYQAVFDSTKVQSARRMGIQEFLDNRDNLEALELEPYEVQNV